MSYGAAPAVDMGYGPTTPQYSPYYPPQYPYPSQQFVQAPYQYGPQQSFAPAPYSPVPHDHHYGPPASFGQTSPFAFHPGAFGGFTPTPGDSGSGSQWMQSPPGQLAQHHHWNENSDDRQSLPNSRCSPPRPFTSQHGNRNPRNRKNTNSSYKPGNMRGGAQRERGSEMNSPFSSSETLNGSTQHMNNRYPTNGPESPGFGRDSITISRREYDEMRRELEELRGWKAKMMRRIFQDCDARRTPQTSHKEQRDRKLTFPGASAPEVTRFDGRTKQQFNTDTTVSTCESPDIPVQQPIKTPAQQGSVDKEFIDNSNECEKGRGENDQVVSAHTRKTNDTTLGPAQSNNNNGQLVLYSEATKGQELSSTQAAQTPPYADPREPSIGHGSDSHSSGGGKEQDTHGSGASPAAGSRGKKEFSFNPMASDFVSPETKDNSQSNGNHGATSYGYPVFQSPYGQPENLDHTRAPDFTPTLYGPSSPNLVPTFGPRAPSYGHQLGDVVYYEDLVLSNTSEGTKSPALVAESHDVVVDIDKALQEVRMETPAHPCVDGEKNESTKARSSEQETSCDSPIHITERDVHWIQNDDLEEDTVSKADEEHIPADAATDLPTTAIDVIEEHRSAADDTKNENTPNSSLAESVGNEHQIGDPKLIAKGDKLDIKGGPNDGVRSIPTLPQLHAPKRSDVSRNKPTTVEPTTVNVVVRPDTQSNVPLKASEKQGNKSKLEDEDEWMTVGRSGKAQKKPSPIQAGQRATSRTLVPGETVASGFADRRPPTNATVALRASMANIKFDGKRKLYIPEVPKTLTYVDFMSVIHGGLIDDVYVSGLSPDQHNHHAKMTGKGRDIVNEPWFAYITFYSEEGATKCIDYWNKLDDIFLKANPLYNKSKLLNSRKAVAFVHIKGERYPVYVRDHDQRDLQREIVEAVRLHQATRVLVFTFKKDIRGSGINQNHAAWQTWKESFTKDAGRGAIERMKKSLQIWYGKPTVYLEAMEILPQEASLPTDIAPTNPPKLRIGGTEPVFRIKVSLLRISVAERVKTILERDQSYRDHCLIAYLPDPCIAVPELPESGELSRPEYTIVGASKTPAPKKKKKTKKVGSIGDTEAFPPLPGSSKPETTPRAPRVWVKPGSSPPSTNVDSSTEDVENTIKRGVAAPQNTPAGHTPSSTPMGNTKEVLHMKSFTAALQTLKEGELQSGAPISSGSVETPFGNPATGGTVSANTLKWTKLDWSEDF